MPFAIAGLVVALGACQAKGCGDRDKTANSASWPDEIFPKEGGTLISGQERCEVPN